MLLLLLAAACADDPGSGSGSATGAGAGAGPGSPAITSSSTSSIQGDLRLDLAFQQTAFAADEAVTATVTITNTSNHQVKLLTWFLPSSDLESSTFAIAHGSGRAGFLGPDFKRGHAGNNDFVHLASGASITAQIDLARFYDFSAGGDYQVQLELDAAQLLSANVAGKLTTQPVSLWIEARQAAAPEPVTIEATVGTLSFSRCTVAQQAEIATAVSNAGTISQQALDYLSFTVPAGTPRYTTWFGAFDPARWNTAASHFVSIADAFATKPITVDCKCKKNYYAYVYPSQPYTIYVCKAFWSAPPTGTDSKAGTLVHEMSHFDVTAGTNDWDYGQTACRSLAQTDPARALDNADSHEYFSENTPALQ